METFFEIKPKLLERSAVAVGFFDGVHKGHQAVIRFAIEEAHKLGVKASIVTFKEHPRTITEGQTPELLTSLEQRLQLFADLGVEVTLALPFTEQISHLSPRQYVEQILLNGMGAQFVSIGYNHHFGRNREGTPKLMQELGSELGFKVHVTPEVFVDGTEASSSHIRQALKSGDVSLASKLLGRYYCLLGEVVHGQSRGKLIGYPTANLLIPQQQLLPHFGVYAGRAYWSKKHYPCAINIGNRPTVTDGRHVAIEAHILDFSEDIHGTLLAVELIQYLRPEIKFSSVDELKQQIGKDCQITKELLAAKM